MRHLAHYHRHIHLVGKIREFWLFELSIWLHTLGMSVVNIFIPILLLQNGFSLGEVLWYYALFNLIDVPLNLLADKTTRALGARKTVIIGTLFAIASLAILNLSTNWTQLVVLAIVSALYDTFYWIAHLYIFTRAQAKQIDAGEGAGIMSSVRTIASLLGPMTGGLVLIFKSEHALLILSSVLLLLSLLPLFKMKISEDIPEHKHFVWPKTFFKHKKERFAIWNFFLNCFNYPAEGILWPLFIFLTIGTLKSVAILATIASWSTVLFSYLNGKLASKHHAKMIIIGALGTGAIWVGRIFLENYSWYYVSLVLIGFFGLIANIPIEARVLEIAKTSEPVSTMTYRNASSMFAPFIFFLIVAITVNVFHVGFSIAAISMFLLSGATIVWRKSEA